MITMINDNIMITMINDNIMITMINDNIMITMIDGRLNFSKHIREAVTKATKGISL